MEISSQKENISCSLIWYSYYSWVENLLCENSLARLCSFKKITLFWKSWKIIFPLNKHLKENVLTLILEWSAMAMRKFWCLTLSNMKVTDLWRCVAVHLLRISMTSVMAQTATNDWRRCKKSGFVTHSNTLGAVSLKAREAFVAD